MLAEPFVRRFLERRNARRQVLANMVSQWLHQELLFFSLPAETRQRSRIWVELGSGSFEPSDLSKNNY